MPNQAIYLRRIWGVHFKLSHLSMWDNLHSCLLPSALADENNFGSKWALATSFRSVLKKIWLADNNKEDEQILEMRLKPENPGIISVG